MRHFAANVISCGYTLVKLCILKLFCWRRLSFSPVIRFSPDVRIDVGKGSRMKLGNRVYAHSGSKIIASSGGDLRIDDNSGFGYRCMVVCRHRVHIASGVQIGPQVLIYDHDHDFRARHGLKARKYQCGAVTIGENTWIGANTVILRGTTIGKNCVIAAGSVVKGSVPDNTVLVQKRETIMSEIEREEEE